jgi:hypothetical protein
MGQNKKIEEQKKGTPIKVIKTPENNFSTKNGMLYAFTVEFDNGDKGQYKARDVNNPKFKEGIETEYILEKVTSDDPNKNWTIYNIKSINSNNFNNNGYKPRTMTKEEQISIFKQVVIEKSIEFERELIKAHIAINIDVSELLKTWLSEIIKKGISEEVNQQLGINASSAFKITIGKIINRCLISGNTNSLSEFSKIYNSVFNFIKI